ncbi:MAG: serine/threonine-protein kinase PknK, partial [Cyanobacteria bacterium J06633_8]
MVFIQGYHLKEELYNGSRTLVYRGIREKDEKPVVIKLLKNLYPNFNELLQFRNQYAIAKNLNIPGIIRPYSLEAYQNGYALVMEDFGGISLREYLKTFNVENLNLTSLENILSITLQITDILHNLHQNRVIHKDIKPDNILINPETKQIKLIDFSIASLLPKETQSIKNPNSLEGTLAYISPEQTGRMNRGIDYRSDYYSLGVTLYELLTGELPFKSDDAMELVHCHIAKQAPSVNSYQLSVNSKYSQVISDIVIKLMAKNAEDRYQSALGLKYDLEVCLKQLRETGNIEKFEIGKRDICDRFIIPEKLYGREKEVEELLTAFERVSQGNRELMLVAGFSGIGKTAVVNEVHKPIVKQHGYFIKGKFDQFNRNIPFSAFVQAFRDLMGQLLSETDAQLSSWKNQILQALGENGQVIIDVIPELERIIGQQSPVTELSGSAAKNRFNLLFQNFIQVFTTKEHPLVIFLDDLQWADSASLKLLKLLMAESETGYLLVLGAYRDNEVFPAHPLMLTLEDIKKHQVQIHTLTLKTLALEYIQQLVADTLLCTRELAAPLGELVYQKTQGNPFFATQFLQGLYEEDCITFEATAGYWQCNLAQIRQLLLSDDVVEFMVMRLHKLPEATQDVLKLAACIGNQFDLNTLAIVCEQSQENVADSLWKALQEGFLIPQSEVYKFYLEEEQKVSVAEVEEVANYKFLHDRVQQAAYSLILKNRRQEVHLKIGRLLRDKTAIEQQEGKIFEIINQINIGASLLVEPKEKEDTAKLNLVAGNKAKQATAYGVSAQYFKTGLQLLEANCWHQQYSITFTLYQKLAEVEFLNGNFEQCDYLIDYALSQVESPIDRVKLYNLLIIRHTISADYQKAIEMGREALSLLGESLPETDLENELNIELNNAKNKLGSKKINSLINANNIEIPEKEIAIEVLKNIDPPAYFVDLPLYSVIVVRSVNLSLQYGNAPESPKGFSTYGLLQGAMFGKYYDGLEFGKLALELSDKLNNPSQKCQACVIVGGYLKHWVKHLKTSDFILSEGYQVGLECGDLQFAGYSLIFKALHIFYSGTNLETVLTEISPLLQFAHKTQNHWSIDAITACEIISLNLCGKTLGLDDFSTPSLKEDEYLNLSKSHGSSSWIGTYLIIKSRILHIYGNFEAGLALAQEAESYLSFIIGHFSFAEHNYSMSLNLIACLQQKIAIKSEQNEAEIDLELDKIDANQKQLKKWADSCPENFLHKYELIQAELSQLMGEKLSAIELYDKAIAGAKENDFIQEEALANELAAKFYLDWGKEKVAAGYMQSAYYCYAKWGAKAKTDDLEKRYPDLLQPILQQAAVSINLGETFPQNSTQTNNSSVTNINNALDFSSILKASQTLSSTIELNQLLTQFTQVILQNSGGDCCALILPNSNGEWYVEAIT